MPYSNEPQFSLTLNQFVGEGVHSRYRDNTVDWEARADTCIYIVQLD